MKARSVVTALSVVIALLAFSGCASWHAQKAKVVVSVVDAHCAYPIPGARVIAKSSLGETLEAVTDQRGEATFDVSAGTWRFTPSLEGSYAAETATVHPASGDACTAEVGLDFRPPGTMTISPHGPCRERQPRSPQCSGKPSGATSN